MSVPVRFPTRRHGPVLRAAIAAHRFTESHPIAAWLVAVAATGALMFIGGLTK